MVTALKPILIGKTLGSQWRQYEEAFPKLQQSKIDIISLECHNSHVPMDLIELIRGKKVMVGTIDVAKHWKRLQIRYVKHCNLSMPTSFIHRPTAKWHLYLVKWHAVS